MSPAWRIVRDDLTHPAVISLLEFHLRSAFENSPPNAVFALDLSGLKAPDVDIWSMWEGDTLLGLGAMKAIDAQHGELKSMRTSPTQLRRGVGAAILAHLIEEGRRRGYRRLSLETGNNAAFAPARAMYQRAGFTECDAFGGYDNAAGFSSFYTLEL